ncbi:BMP family protein [Elusimicrobiota bacterium]
MKIISSIINKIPVVFLLLILACDHKQENSSEEAGSEIKVGLVFDIGGRGDKSFNDSAYEGLIKAREELGVYTEYIELSTGLDRESALRLFAARKFDLIFGIGFMFTDDITRLSMEFPDIKFACIDYNVIKDVNIPENLAAIKFREEEGAFLIGAIAALVTKTNIVGFIGGMDIPLIHKFEEGFKSGAGYINKNCNVLTAYAGVTAEAFKNPSKGKELAISQYKNGADIVFHASGSTGLGVFEAARKLDKRAIGVDADQYHEAPGYILTSMIKRVDVAVLHTVEDLIAGTFTGGLKNHGLKEGALGYVYDDNNYNMISASVVSEVEKIKKLIIEGKINISLKK